ncbi:hypothetical protein EVAR_690_1 [Eumeta japonica]|uniref:Uncharacterized protein n=1 Tax=Eumeta variegata TaxID=151549 RepID=A0A4C1SDS9_EUMVA|nr:hypothetical protein EVAR_690_1 [Eumeta japonica]
MAGAHVGRFRRNLRDTVDFIPPRSYFAPSAIEVWCAQSNGQSNHFVHSQSIVKRSVLQEFGWKGFICSCSHALVQHRAGGRRALSSSASPCGASGHAFQAEKINFKLSLGLLAKPELCGLRWGQRDILPETGTVPPGQRNMISNGVGSRSPERLRRNRRSGEEEWGNETLTHWTKHNGGSYYFKSILLRTLRAMKLTSSTQARCRFEAADGRCCQGHWEHANVRSQGLKVLSEA